VRLNSQVVKQTSQRRTASGANLTVTVSNADPSKERQVIPGKLPTILLPIRPDWHQTVSDGSRPQHGTECG